MPDNKCLDFGEYVSAIYLTYLSLKKNVSPLICATPSNTMSCLQSSGVTGPRVGCGPGPGPGPGPTSGDTSVMVNRDILLR